MKAACLYRTAPRHVDLRPLFGLLHHFDFCLFVICCDYMDGTTKKQSNPKTGFTGECFVFPYQQSRGLAVVLPQNYRRACHLFCASRTIFRNIPTW